MEMQTLNAMVAHAGPTVVARALGLTHSYLSRIRSSGDPARVSGVLAARLAAMTGDDSPTARSLRESRPEEWAFIEQRRAEHPELFAFLDSDDLRAA